MAHPILNIVFIAHQPSKGLKCDGQFKAKSSFSMNERIVCPKPVYGIKNSLVCRTTLLGGYIDRGRNFGTVWEELLPIQSATTLRRNRLVRFGHDALLSSHLCALGICIKESKACTQ